VTQSRTSAHRAIGGCGGSNAVGQIHGSQVERSPSPWATLTSWNPRYTQRTLSPLDTGAHSPRAMASAARSKVAMAAFCRGLAHNSSGAHSVARRSHKNRRRFQATRRPTPRTGRLGNDQRQTAKTLPAATRMVVQSCRPLIGYWVIQQAGVFRTIPTTGRAIFSLRF